MGVLLHPPGDGWAERRRPDLPVILATGRADQGAFDLAAKHARVSILPKPFSLAELRSQLGAMG